MTSEQKAKIDVGKSLRIIMAARNVSNAELAKDLDLASSMGITYYRKRKSLNSDIVERLANHFGLSVGEFLNLAALVD
jgi:plasmid maintenance system antidote protein VapI